MTEKVLIVDDEEDVLKSTQMMVGILGYEAIALTDPGRVIEVAEKERPGVILQDLKMKDLNVAGLVASLRSNPATADIPLVFFSASGDLASTAAKYDAWGYLPKPFGEKELAQVLDKSIHGEAPANSGVNALRDVRTVFHDFWNLVAALNTYVELLARSPKLDPADRRIVEALSEVVLKFESKTDRLRSYIMALLA